MNKKAAGQALPHRGEKTAPQIQCTTPLEARPETPPAGGIERFRPGL